MDISKLKEEIDEIMEEMEAATPKLIEMTRTFSSYSEPVSDAVDAKRQQSINSENFDEETDAKRSSFFSSIFEQIPSKPGKIHPSRPTNDRYYDFSNPKLGHAVIFNQINIKGESRRNGTEKDATDLSHVLNEIGFTVKICTDFTSKQIAQELFSCKYNNKELSL